jgi:hypothetical protein
MLRALRGEVEALRSETRPLLAELRSTTDEARDAMETARADLERFDRVLGSAEAIGEAVSGTGRVARTAFSAPVIKAAGLATGTSRAMRRLRGRDGAGSMSVERVEVVQVGGRNRRRGR